MFANKVAYLASLALEHPSLSLDKTSDTTTVLLHGIGSGATSWKAQLEAANRAKLKVAVTYSGRLCKQSVEWA
jgi:hypothetical protein